MPVYSIGSGYVWPSKYDFVPGLINGKLLVNNKEYCILHVLSNPTIFHLVV
jgi:hypothetical protein